MVKKKCIPSGVAVDINAKICQQNRRGPQPLVSGHVSREAAQVRAGPEARHPHQDISQSILYAQV